MKKGSTDLLTLSLLENQSRHGYEIRQLIESHSGGFLKLHVSSLYPLLYRMEKRGWIQGRWVEKAGQRRRRYYRITERGSETLRSQRDLWKEFTAAVNQVLEVDHA